MKMKRLISAFLAAAMTISLASCGSSTSVSSTAPTADSSGSAAAESSKAEATKYPDYLNLDSQAPIIKDDSKGKIKPTMLLVQDSTGGKWNDVWVSKFYKAKYNLEFDVESVLNTAWDERKSTLFASDDLPDILMCCGLSTPEIYKYGQQEQLLLQCDKYINEKLTPNTYRYFQDNGVATAAKTPDGHVYTMPSIDAKDDEGAYLRLFVHKKDLDAMNIKIPKTLDDFTKMLYAYKQKDPHGVGKDSVYPLGGGMDVQSNAVYLLNALGYITGDPYGVSPALREGKVVIPAYDPSVFKEYLKLMNQYYKDGIINPNYFTIENTEALAQLNKGQTLVFRDPVYTTGLKNWSEWDSVYPLTSQWNSKQQWPATSYVSVGGFAISAKTKYPELCMRFADIFYAEDSRDMWAGPGEKSKYNFGFVNTKLNAAGNYAGFVDSDLPKGVDLWTYLMKDLVGFVPPLGALNDTPAIAYEVKSRGGTYPEKKVFELSNPDQQYRSCVYKNLVPYAVPSFPGVYYLDDATNTRLTDLTAVIQPYVKEQVAQFITGKRPINEVDKFAEELKSQGIEDLLKIYQDIYSKYGTK